MREFNLTTGLACEQDKTEKEPLFRQVKKPYLWMLSKGDKYTVRSLYDLPKKKAKTMTRLERLSIGIAIITEGVIIAENSSSLITEGISKLLVSQCINLQSGSQNKTIHVCL